jgi:HD superfamily phosphodiesterase
MFNPKIEQAEDKWLHLVKVYLSKLFKDCWLPSHDIKHHERVWKNACFLDHTINDEHFYEKLLIACFFHDVGLTVTKDKSHGLESRRFCERFLQVSHQMVDFETEQLLEAIENHDDKDYSSLMQAQSNHLLDVLAVADDMDAFGALGVYRYIEIYLLREVHEQLNQKILNNALKRYNHCLKYYHYYQLNTTDLTFKFDCLTKIITNNNFNDTVI